MSRTMTNSTGGMATAVSIDQTNAHASCHCTDAPELEVQFVSVHQDGVALSTAARQQEVFIDWTCLQMSHYNGSFLLDERFDSFLDEEHQTLKTSIKTMLTHLPPACRELAVYRKLHGFLSNNLGLESLDERRQQWLVKSTRPSAVLREKEEESRRKEPIPVSVAAVRAAAMSRNKSIDNHPRYQPSNHPQTAGHVFCINGSVCDVACDAFLCPATLGKNDAIVGSIFARWIRHQQETYPEFYQLLLQKALPAKRFPRKHYSDYPCAATLRDWPWNDFESATQLPVPLPLLVAGHVGYSDSTTDLPPIDNHVAALERSVQQVIQVSLHELNKNQPLPRYKRERYLIAIPVLGTGFSGAIDLTGQIIQKLLHLLVERARHDKADFVLVCADDATYALAQHMRFSDQTLFPCFMALDKEENLKQHSQRLAKLACEGQLSLFLGAGVSVGSGLPTWFNFLNMVESLFTANGKPDELTLGNRLNWNPLAMASALQDICESTADRFGVEQSFKDRIQSMLGGRSRNPGILLYMLLALSAKCMVTQNYDQLIERAMECRSVADGHADNTLSVIPYRPIRGTSRWLLKMHGCVSTPGDIVITEKDYENYEAGRLQTLSGLVQANLITSHFLFVGFSLTDPNYLRILRQVRLALEPNLNGKV